MDVWEIHAKGWVSLELLETSMEEFYFNFHPNYFQN
jgi:hypothetical protein